MSALDETLDDAAVKLLQLNHAEASMRRSAMALEAIRRAGYELDGDRRAHLAKSLCRIVKAHRRITGARPPGDDERRPGGGGVLVADEANATVRRSLPVKDEGAPAEIRARRHAHKGKHLFTYVAPRPWWVRHDDPPLPVKVDGARLLRCPECVSDDLALRRALGTSSGVVAELVCHHCGGRYDLELRDQGAGVDLELRAAGGAS